MTVGDIFLVTLQKQKFEIYSEKYGKLIYSGFLYNFDDLQATVLKVRVKEDIIVIVIWLSSTSNIKMFHVKHFKIKKSLS